MAPQTNIGAAHPVFAGGGPQSEPSSEDAKTLTKKVTNDAVALIRNLAEVRGRDAVWAERAVRESVSATATEAARMHVVDFVAQDEDDFLRKAEGKRVKLGQGERALHTAGAGKIDVPMNWREEFLYRLAHPNVAYILLMLGIYALILELKSPTHGAAGAFGAICLILALYSLSVLPVNFAGLALILVGVGFLFVELIHHTHGVLTLGGTISLAIGSLILINGGPDLQVSRPLIGGVVAATVAFFVFCLGAIVRSQKRKVVTGAKGMIGLVGEARTALDPEGTVFVDGAWWSARCEEGKIEAGEAVEVLEVDGLHLVVRKASPSEAS
jgi:membrane-bound serine protease (ClpP class)